MEWGIARKLLAVAAAIAVTASVVLLHNATPFPLLQASFPFMDTVGWVLGLSPALGALWFTGRDAWRSVGLAPYEVRSWPYFVLLGFAIQFVFQPWLVAIHLLPAPAPVPPSREIVTTAALASVYGVATALAAGFFEELVFRGFLQRRLLRFGIHPAGAIAISSIAFAIAHREPQKIAVALMLGPVFGVLAFRARSIWPAIVAHATIDLWKWLEELLKSLHAAELIVEDDVFRWSLGMLILLGCEGVARRSDRLRAIVHLTVNPAEGVGGSAGTAVASPTETFAPSTAAGLARESGGSLRADILIPCTARHEAHDPQMLG